MAKIFVFFVVILGVFVIAFLCLGWLAIETEPSEQLKDLPLLVSDDFEDGDAQGWKPNIPKNWEVGEEKSGLVYRLTAPGPPGEVRAPTSWSILKDFVDIIFHYQDPTHFYYVHFSAVSDEVHNIIGLVNGKDRVKINHELPGQSIARMNDLEFHEFKVTYNAETGEIKVYLDDMKTPVLTATDKTLKHGYVGLGSFDDTGSFDDIKLWGKIFIKKN